MEDGTISWHHLLPENFILSSFEMPIIAANYWFQIYFSQTGQSVSGAKGWRCLLEITNNMWGRKIEGVENQRVREQTDRRLSILS